MLYCCFQVITQTYHQNVDSHQRCGTRTVKVRSLTCLTTDFEIFDCQTGMNRRAVYRDGRVCISILHAPGDDPHAYESAEERWSPVQSVSIDDVTMVRIFFR